MTISDKHSYKLVQRICQGCNDEYDAREVDVLGVKMVFGGKYCEKCSSKKRIELEQRQTRLKETETEANRLNWRLSSDIPRRFLTQSFETFQYKRTPSLENAYLTCIEYAEGFTRQNYQNYKSLVLYSDGVWGVGKSHLVSAIVHKILDSWAGESGSCPVRYISEPALFLRIRSTFNRAYGEERKETEEEVYRELTTIPLLVLDDVGKEEVSDSRFVQRVLFHIINNRYENMLPVIITANLNVDMLERHLGGDRNNSASFERLMEMTGNVFLEIQATTYRDFRNRGDTTNDLPDR